MHTICLNLHVRSLCPSYGSELSLTQVRRLRIAVHLKGSYRHISCGKGQENRSLGRLPTSKHHPSMPGICDLSFRIMVWNYFSELFLPAAIFYATFGYLRSDRCCIACGSLVAVESPPPKGSHLRLVILSFLGLFREVEIRVLVRPVRQKPGNWLKNISYHIDLLIRHGRNLLWSDGREIHGRKRSEEKIAQFLTFSMESISNY